MTLPSKLRSDAKCRLVRVYRPTKFTMTLGQMSTDREAQSLVRSKPIANSAIEKSLLLEISSRGLIRKIIITSRKISALQA